MPRTTAIWNISLPPEMAKEAETVAKKEARTKSELVREALRQYLWSAKWRNLQAYGQKQARKLGIREEDVERLIDETRS
jgi:CopG family transcriptional regulator/antitoxin EndoAI